MARRSSKAPHPIRNHHKDSNKTLPFNTTWINNTTVILEQLSSTLSFDRLRYVSFLGLFLGRFSLSDGAGDFLLERARSQLNTYSHRYRRSLLSLKAILKASFCCELWSYFHQFRSSLRSLELKRDSLLLFYRCDVSLYALCLY